jgi:hypothetical protein
MNLNIVSSKHSLDVFKNSQFEKMDEKTQQKIGTLKLEKPMEVLFEGADLEKYFEILVGVGIIIENRMFESS